MSEVDDGALLRRAARGDEAAFAELYDRLAPMLVLRLRRRCADDDMVADVVQESFTAAWCSAGSWTGQGDVGAWVWTIAARRLVDAFRRRAARVATVAWEPGAAGLPSGAVGAVGTNGTTRTDSAEELVLSGLLAGPLEAAVAGLSPDLRAVLQATVLDGLTVREAAVVLGLPEGTVKTRAMRARASMREALA